MICKRAETQTGHRSVHFENAQLVKERELQMLRQQVKQEAAARSAAQTFRSRKEIPLKELNKVKLWLKK